MSTTATPVEEEVELAFGQPITIAEETVCGDCEETVCICLPDAS